mgnify:CR=1 FL=1
MTRNKMMVWPASIRLTATLHPRQSLGWFFSDLMQRWCFNSELFIQCALIAGWASGDDLRCFVVNTILISHRYQWFSGVERPQAKLGKSDVKLVLAGRQSEIGTSFQRIGEPVENVSELIFPTLRQAVNAFKAL